MGPDNKPQVVPGKILELYQNDAKIMQMNYQQTLQVVDYSKIFKLVQQDEELEIGQNLYCLWYDFEYEDVWTEFRLAKVVETYPNTLIVKVEFYSDKQNYVQIYKQYCTKQVKQIDEILSNMIQQQEKDQQDSQ